MTETRTGPRPLAMHLTAAAAISTTSLSAWPLLRSGWTPWSENLLGAGKALQRELADANPEAFAAALVAELTRRHDAYLTGLETYRDHRYRRTLDDPPPLWEAGPVQLRDYGAQAAPAAAGRPLLVIPSMINRSYILDLTERQSFLRFLSAKGFRPLLVDWGTPDDDRLDRTLDEIIAVDLRQMLVTACEAAGDAPVPVLGYCMGGTMAVGLAATEPERVSALALLAAPWDFHVGTNGPPAFVTAGRPALDSILTTLGCLPVDVLQALFLSIDPVLGWKKFRQFAGTDPGSENAEMFVALEDWINDGVPLGAAVARECLFGWYGDNAPARNDWHIDGSPVVPGDLAMPALAVYPSRDRIVPPASAAALAQALPVCDTLQPAAGHIGMMVGGKARKSLWEPVARWLTDRAATP